MSEEESVPLGSNITGFLRDCQFRVSCQSPNISQGSGLYIAGSLEKLLHTNLRKLLHLQLSSCQRRGGLLSHSKRQVRQVTVTGAANGLVLEMFLDQENYMYNKLSRRAGARITIHDP